MHGKKQTMWRHNTEGDSTRRHVPDGMPDMVTLLRADFDEIWEYDLPWEKLQNSAILVTGASGLIGSAMVYSLIDRNRRFGSNIRIYALARNEERMREKFGGYEGMNFIAQDVCDDIDGCPPRVDYIIHAACDVQTRRVAHNPVETARTNTYGTFSVLELARRTGAKVILMSSINIYGKATEENFPFSEHSEVVLDLSDSGYVYSEAKRMAEMICASYATQHGVKYSALRIAKVYGPTLNRGDSMVMSSFIYDAVTGKDLYLKSNGTQKYTYVYVADVVCAIYLLMFKGDDGAYNCGEGTVIEKMNFGEMVKTLADITGVKIHRLRMDDEDKKVYSNAPHSVMTSDSLMRLGWKKKADIKSGLLKSVDILNALIGTGNL